MNFLDKKNLRNFFQNQRDQISSSEKIKAAEKINTIFLNSDFFNTQTSKKLKIGAYLASNDLNELDINFLIFSLAQLGHEIYLPIIQSQDKSLRFRGYRPNITKLKSHPNFKILEPEAQTPDWLVSAEILDIIFLPLVAFDTQGTRLGMGGGYYDRTLANQSHPTHPILIGCAYTFQQAEHLPKDPWDKPLNFVLTEKFFLKF